jgi:ankyrin repeat protein
MTDNGMTPVYVASQEGHLEVVRELLGSDADPNMASDDGSTPLSIATKRRHIKVVQLTIPFMIIVNAGYSCG